MKTKAKTNTDEQVSKNKFIKLSKKDQKEIVGGWSSRSSTSSSTGWW